MSGLIVLIKYIIRGIKEHLCGDKNCSNTKVTKCDTMHNEWIINGKVYDLREFLDFHPGGKYILLMNKGRDCTELFFMYHMSSNKNMKHFMSLLNKYYICDASDEQIKTPFNWNGQNYEIYLDFRSRIQSYFNEHKEMHGNREKASYFRMIWYFFLFISLICVYIYWFNAYWITIPLLSILHWLLSTDLLHNGTHYQLVRNANINQLLSLFGGFYHSPNIQWEMQHVISHHSYTNINTLDIDLNHFLDNFRTSKQQKYKTIYAKWRYFMPLYILFTSIGQIDFWGATNERNIHRLMVPFWTNNNITSTYVLCLYFIQITWIFIIIPSAIIYQFGINQFLKAYLFVILPRIGHGVLFYIFSQISHVQSDAFHDNDNGNLPASDSWIFHQIQSCVDYSIYSTFWNIMSIGLNNQTIHHLAPTVHPCHYIELQPVLDKFCDDYHMKRRVHPNIFATLLCHFQHLGRVNDTAKSL